MTAPTPHGFAAAIASAKTLDPVGVAFGPSLPHFDSGLGLAPFATFKLEAGTKTIETASPLQLVGFVYGGDGNPRYVDVQLIFFSATGGRLPTRLLDRGQVMTSPGVRLLFQYFEVPLGADVLVMTTDPAKNGSVEWTRFYAPPTVPLTGNSTEFMQFNGLLPYKFLLANYGPGAHPRVAKPVTERCVRELVRAGGELSTIARRVAIRLYIGRRGLRCQQGR